MASGFDEVRQYNFPTVIRFGAGVVKELGPYLLESGLSRPLIVTDTTIANLHFFREITAPLERLNLSVEVFYDIHKNPVKSDVLKGVDAFKALNRDAVVGIGGGAAIDVARAIVLGIHHHRDLFDYDDLEGGEQFITSDVPHFVTIPTTSGTGSEVGRSAIISEDDTKRKRILFSPKLLAKRVFADPVLTMDLPPFITAATGMDALTHNMEAFLAKGFHPMADGIALRGMKLIAENIEAAVHHPSLNSRANMMIASMMGAVAFQKGLGVVHSMAHPLSSLLDTHHGLANAICLPYGMQFNAPGMEPAFNEMAQALGLGMGAAAQITPYLFALNQKLQLPTRLREIGVSPAHLLPLSNLALADFCHPANPKPVSLHDFRQLYEAAW